MAVSKITVQEFSADKAQAERKVRRHLRKLGQGVGRGNRYALTAAQRKSLSKSLGA